VNARSTHNTSEAEVVVVGAGTSGSVVAAELARRGIDVVVLESGSNPPPPPWWSLAGAFSPDTSEGTAAVLATGRTVTTRRGRGVGGSAAVNGCYWIRGTAADHADWVECTGERRWAHAQVDLVADTLEADADVVARCGRIPVQRDTDLEAVSEAFVAATASRGIPWVDDLNAGSDAGVGPVPFNVRDGRRVDPATAMGVRGDEFEPFGGRLETDTQVVRLVIEAGRAVGVDTVGPAGQRRWRAGQVICCAGALGTALLLWESGIGVADDLTGPGRAVVADLPVGVAAWDHPSIDLPYRPRPGAVATTETNFMQLALHLDDPEVGGVVEILPTRRPYGTVTGSDPDDRLLSLRVTSMRPRSRVVARLGADGRPALHYGTLDVDGDLSVLCAAVASTTDLARSPEFAAVVAEWHGPGPDVLGDHSRLAAWVTERVGSAFHLGGTAPMGRPGGAGAVVDGRLRVLGVPGLWVADAAVLPAPLRRGPAATVAALGAIAAEHVAAAVR